MRTRLSLFCDKLIEAGWLAALVIVPLFFNIYSQRVFEPDKLSLLRSIALVMGVAWLVRLVEDWRTARDEPAPAPAGRRAERAERPEEPAPKGPSLWRRMVRTPLVLPTLLLVLMYLISTLLSVSPRVSFLGSYQRLQGTYTTLSYIVVFAMVAQGLRTRRQLNRIVNVIILTSFPIALYGLVQHFNLDPLPWGGNVTYRVASNMGNAIFVAAYLIMIVPLTLARLLENWKDTAAGAGPLDAVLGAVSFGLLAVALAAGMLIRQMGGSPWLIAVALLVAVALQVPLYLLMPARRRNPALTIAVPVSFAFLVGFAWTMELIVPPAKTTYFWLGLLALVIFAVAMVAFAVYLRRSVARLLLVAAYFSILITQVICIFYTQSRGPLLGFLAGLFFFLALLGLVRRQIWLPWAAAAFAIVAVVGLVAFNTINTPLFDQLRETRYIGRLGKFLQTESGTGKVRILIWEGASNMIDWHAPLEFPGDPPRYDTWNSIRPFVGYGPESMYVAYNRFYPPDLAHYEKRNASPDRSHNETFDALVTTGWVGFVVYIFLFTSVFYFGLRFLKMIQRRWHKWAFLALWVAGGVLGLVLSWALLGQYYIGIGIPLGLMGGLGAYLLIFIIHATRDAEVRGALGGRYSLWMLALIAAIVAHFVEIHLGIAIAATRTYFWTFAALMVVIGTRLMPEAEAVAAEVAPAAAKTAAEAAGRRRRRRGGAAPVAAKAAAATAGERDWMGAVLFLSAFGLLVLGTMLFDFVTVQNGYPGAFVTLWKSITVSKGSGPVLVGLFGATWLMIGLVGLADLATREDGARMRGGDWVAAAGWYAGITVFGGLIYGLLHAVRLRPVTISTPNTPNPIANTITYYYISALALMLGMAAALTFGFKRLTRPVRSGDSAGLAGVSVTAVVLSALALLIIYASNVSIVRADILYKQGLSSEKSSQWDGAIYFYREAIDLAKDQDFYYLFLGRAYMEKGRTLTGAEQESWMNASEEALSKAREIAPLNTDHSANLARLYRTWGSLSSGQAQVERLDTALDYYAEATSLSPHNATLFNEYGQTYVALGQVADAQKDTATAATDYADAQAKYEQSLELDTKYESTYLLMGELAMQRKDWSAARTAYEQAITVNSRSATAYAALGYIYTQLDDKLAAMQAYEKAVELSPRTFANRKNLAIIYQQLGMYTEAISQTQQAIKLAPSDQKETMQAFLVQLKRQQSAPSAENAAKAQELLTAGQAQMEAEEWITAEQTLSQVLALDPGSAQAHSSLAYVLAKQGKIDEAIAENLTTLELAPTDYNSHKNLAILYQQKGDLDKALAEAQQALSMAPDSEKETLQSYVDQLTKLTGGESTATQKASDLQPAQRNNMYKAAPPMTIDTSKKYLATIVTAKGNIVLTLNAQKAPQTVNNFVYLARQGFYDGLTFHRVETSASFNLIQGGDPLGTGQGGPGYTVPAEIGLLHDVGAIAMARTADSVNPERASSGSQFYICLVPIHQLDGAYTVFGYITSGLDVAKKIVVDDKILSVTITEQ